MKKYIIAAALLAAAPNAYALPTCSQYGPSCYLETHGLTSILAITPLEFPNGTYPFYGFSESEFVSLGLSEYITWASPTVADIAPAGPPNPMEVLAIQQLNTIVTGKLDIPTGTTSQAMRGNGTVGTLPVSAITGLAAVATSGNYTDISGKPSLATVATSGSYNDLSNKPAVQVTVYNGTSQVSNPIFWAGTANVTSGTATYQLTADGLSTGTALCPTGPKADTLNYLVSDSAAAYQMSYAFSNSNKTLTITVNKLTTANILTGVLGQSAAPNGTTVKAQLWCS